MKVLLLLAGIIGFELLVVAGLLGLIVFLVFTAPCTYGKK